MGFPDRSVRVLSLEQDLTPLARLVCTVEPSAVSLISMPGEAGEVCLPTVGLYVCMIASKESRHWFQDLLFVV